MELHYLKVAAEIRLPNSNKKLAVIQEEVKIVKEFTLKMEPGIYNKILSSAKTLTSVIQHSPARFEKGPITYWTKFEPTDIHGTYFTINPHYDRRKELVPARQNGPNGPGIFSIQFIIYLLDDTYNGDPIEHIGRTPFELLS